MNPNASQLALALSLLLLQLLLPACAPLSVPVSQAAIPPLGQASRQPQPPTWCLPTCLEKLNSDYATWQQRLTPAGKQGQPASAPMIR